MHLSMINTIVRMICEKGRGRILPSHALGQEEVCAVVGRGHLVTMRAAAAVPRHQDTVSDDASRDDGLCIPRWRPE